MRKFINMIVLSIVNLIQEARRTFIQYEFISDFVQKSQFFETRNTERNCSKKAKFQKFEISPIPNQDRSNSKPFVSIHFPFPPIQHSTNNDSKLQENSLLIFCLRQFPIIFIITPPCTTCDLSSPPHLSILMKMPAAITRLHAFSLAQFYFSLLLLNEPASRQAAACQIETSPIAIAAARPAENILFAHVQMHLIDHGPAGRHFFLLLSLHPASGPASDRPTDRRLRNNRVIIYICIYMHNIQ